MTGKASLPTTRASILQEYGHSIRSLYGLNAVSSSVLSILAPVKGSINAGGDVGEPGNALNPDGDTMIGPIAFAPIFIQIDSNGAIDIGPNTGATPPDYSTYIIVGGIGSPDDLYFIDGTAFPGQLSIVQGTITQIINIKNSTLFTISTISGNGVNTITVETTAAHGYSIGDIIETEGTTNYNTRTDVVSVPTTTSLTFNLTTTATVEETFGTIKNGNIITSDGDDVPLDGTATNRTAPISELIFDFTLAGNGAHRVITNPNSGANLLASDNIWTGTNTWTAISTFEGGIQINDSSSNTHGLLQGLINTGVRLTLTAGEQFNIFDNITNILQMDSTTGLQIFGNNLVMGTGGNITSGGAGEGMTNIGHLDFVDNLATPATALSIYSDGVDMLVNTGGSVVNLSDIGDGIFLDSTFRILGSGDLTKQLAFEVDTNVPSSSTVTMTIPSASGTIFITPAQDDLDLNTFDIFDIDKLAFMNFASTGSSLNIGFSALGNGGFRANVLNNGDFEITEENTLHFSFDGGLNSINVVDSLFNVTETIGTTSLSIVKFNGRTDISEPTEMNLQIAGSNIMTLNSSTIDLADGISISNVDQIGFRNLGNLIEDDANGLIFTCIPTNDFTWDNGTDTFAILDVDGLFLNDMFIQIDSITAPTTSGVDVGKIFMDASNSNHLSVVRDTTVVDLEGSGSQTPWESEIDADENNLVNLSNLVFTDTVAGPSATTTAISAGPGGMAFNVGNGEIYLFESNLGDGVTIAANEIHFSSGRAHEILAFTSTFVFIAELANDALTFWNGTSVSNETLTIENFRSTWKTSNSDTQAYILQIVQNNDDPVDDRTIGNIDFIAENNASEDIIYSRISVTSSDVSDGSEDGLLQFGVISGGSLIAPFQIQGNNDDASDGGAIGFHGSTPVAQQFLSSNPTNAQISTVLEALGLTHT